MKLFEAFLQEPSENKPGITAISPATDKHQKTILQNIVVLKIGDNFALPVRYNTPALILQTDSMNILLGYFDPSDKYSHTAQTIADGDMYLTCGSTRGLRLSDDGSIQVVNMFTKDDGEIVIIPILSYSQDNNLDIKFENLVVDMFGANSGGNIAWTQDKTLGINTFISNYKTNNKDLSPRIYQKTTSGPTGITVQYIWDVSPAPIGSVPMPMFPAGVPLSLRAKISSQSPLDLSLMALAAPIFNLNLSPKGDLEVQHKISRATIKMTAPGEITIKSAMGLGEITMSPAGMIKIKGTTTVNIEGKTGVEITGVGTKLVQTLADFVIQEYAKHFHPTAMGPSGPPTTGVTAAAKIGVGQLKKLKGGA